jgi:hypothetical protein
MELIYRKIRSYILENFEFDYNQTFEVPSDVKTHCEKVLPTIQSNNLSSSDDNEGSGMQKCQDLISGVNQNHAQMKRLKSFFDTNKSSYDSEINSGKNIQNSSIIQRWELHGGNPAYNWVNSKIEQFKKSSQSTKDTLRKSGGAGTNKGMGIFQNNVMDTNNQRKK